MSKLFYSLFFLLAAYLAAAVYFDSQGQQQSYDFCQSQSIGLSQDKIKSAASDAGLEFITEQSSKTSWLFVQANPLPYFSQNGCELIFVDGRISQRNLVKY